MSDTIDLKAAREKAGLSQMQLARKALVDQRVISGFENHAQAMSLAFACKVAPHLDVDANDLFKGQQRARILKTRDKVLTAIKSRTDEDPSLEKAIDELTSMAKTDGGPLGVAAKRALITIGNAVLKAAREEEWSAPRDYGNRDTTGRTSRKVGGFGPPTNLMKG
ncbi:MAG: helix-turn-helix transcriptional regulator [Candidatus Geothermincolia bacterium]